MHRFRDRKEAGRKLAARLSRVQRERPVVVALPRGGVPVAFEIARALDAPLDVIVVRKLGVPYQRELGMGAVGEDGVRVLNETVLRSARVGPGALARVEARERAEVESRARRYRGGGARVPLHGRTAVVVDDGIATGSTARAALQIARAHGAARVVLAVPVAPPETIRQLRDEADEIECLATPSPFAAVGEWYANFTQVTDDEVVALLAAAHRKAHSTARDADVEVRSVDGSLPGRLTVPTAPRGLVLFAHGSGSSRNSPRNRFVARMLNEEGFGTLLFDLLTPDEAEDRRNVFDVERLTERLTGATTWAASEVPGAALGYFGASTGAAAALFAAADPRSAVRAVVSRGGRADLAIPRLGQVRAPTLLIVGGLDSAVVSLNEEAARHLRCDHRLEIVPGATHLFEEPGALEQVSSLAARWFTRHLTLERS